MDNRQVNDALLKAFREEGRRIVFWNDADREFEFLLGSLELPGISLIRLDQTSFLEVKTKLDLEDTTGKYLLYDPREEPEYEDDWLLDIRLYSEPAFRADKASIILNDLGLKASLREHVGRRRKFFDNKDRLKKLQSLVASTDGETELDRKMLAVVLKTEQADPFLLVRTACQALVDGTGEHAIDLKQLPAFWEQVEKFDLDGPFWTMTKEYFGYEEQAPSLRNLLIRLMATDFAGAVGDNLPKALSHMLLPGAGAANAVVFLAQWRDSASQLSAYDRLSAAVANELKIENLVGTIDIEALSGTMTFLAAEKEVARGLRDRVIATIDTANPDDLREVVSRRLDGHWASEKFASDAAVPRTAMRAVYEALLTACEFFALRNTHKDGFDRPDAAALFSAYTAEFYKFDQLYRKFCVNADIAGRENWDILKTLREHVEPCYSNWFLTNLALAWGKVVDPEAESGLIRKWKIPGITNEYDFYDDFVAPRLKDADNRRIFVIISDGFRYEAAEELTQRLNGTYRLQAELKAMLSVLPSYTALGMASLLPHEKIAYKSPTEIQVDGLPTATLEQRTEILSRVNGVAIKANDLTAMRKDDGREFVRDKQVVYVYHDRIDSVGEKASMADNLFDACAEAVGEIADLVRHVVNNLNATLVYVTADHGFLFQDSPLTEADKSPIKEEPPGCLLPKRRFLLGRGLPLNSMVWRGSTQATATCTDGMEFWLPKGTNRFHFAGGKKYIHGGAMPQEVAVPVITIRQIKGKGAEDTKVRKVSVQVIGAMHKVTAARHRFKLLQVEAISDRIKPVTLKVAVYDGEEPVTNIENVTFDSVSASMDERMKWIALVLKDLKYDKKKPYHLVLRDAETNVEEQRVDVTIDRAISDDF